MSSTNVELTAREQDMLVKAWLCMDTQPKVDTKKLAALCGYTEGSAGVLWPKLKRKITSGAVGGASAPATPAKKTKTATPRKSKKRKVDEIEESDGEEGGIFDNGIKRGGSVKKEEEEGEEDSDDEVKDFI